MTTTESFELSRRQLLGFIGVAGAATMVNGLLPGRGLLGSGTAFAAGPGGSILDGGALTALRLPHQLPIYSAQNSYLPSGGETGVVGPHAAALTSYTIFDDVVVSPELERYVLIRWGDRVFPDPLEYFGYNADFTAYKPRQGTNDGYLWVNHEYVSFPMCLGAPEAPPSLQQAQFRPATSDEPVIGIDLDGAPQILRWGEFLYNCGGSVVRIRRLGSGRFAPVLRNRFNRRYHGLSGLGLNAGRSDSRPDGIPFNLITAWGEHSYQTGDASYLIGTGPAATDVFPLSVDGLGNQIIGTAFCCSGAYTPWGTVLVAEENFQASLGQFFLGVQENVLPNGTQTGWQVGSPDPYTDSLSGLTYRNYTTGTFFGQVGEKYGWMVEIDPADPTWRARKHTRLGRFRHENVAMREDIGKRLVAYQGDDRRGGHTWKYVSTGKLDGTRDHDSALFEDGVLYVARLDPSGTGTWIPLLPSTPVDPIPPTTLADGEATARGVAASTITAAKIRLPKRNGVAGQTSDGGPFDVTTANEGTAIPDYKTKGGTVVQATLADYYDNQGAILCDAFHAANLVGGTPCARPEDFEVKQDSKRLFMTFTDGAPGSDGYPDSRVFVVAKYTSTVDDAQPFGHLLRLIEDKVNGTGTTFTWKRFQQGGEAGADDGAGWGSIDNLAFDNGGNLWCVTDMSTASHNGFNTTYSGATLQPGQTTINHTSTGSSASSLIGVFGCNWLFCVPTTGPDAGLVLPVAYGPPRSEMTGPTFIGDTLLLAVQHPGEDSPMNGDPNAGGTAGSTLSRSIELLDLNGTLFNQNRTLPRGSNWPSSLDTQDGGAGQPNGPPRPSVVAVRRKPT